ncbi:MAG: glycosyltransferase [bacterium]
MTEHKIAGYSIIQNGIIYPFYDAIFQCLDNVDEFHIFSDEKTAELVQKFTETLSSFYKIKPHIISENSLNCGFATQYLKKIGFEFALMNNPDEFFPTGLKPFLIECANKKQEVAFRIIDFCENLDINCIRFHNSDNPLFENFANPMLKNCIIYPEAIHKFTSLFKSESGANSLKQHSFPIRKREQILLRYSKTNDFYPFRDALREIKEDCERKKNNEQKLEVKFSYTKGYEKSMNISLLWTEAYGVAESLARKFNVKTMAEIGVARGHHSLHLLEAMPNLHLYSIDPWGHYLNEHRCMFQKDQKEMDILYEHVSSSLKPFGERSKIIRSTSKRAADKISEPLDMIFIDADHSYKSVKEDIGLWWDKVKIGGIISGHDYNHSCHPGVTKAVNEYFSNKKIRVNSEIGNVWWAQKPEEMLSYIIPTYNSEKYIEETVESIFNQRLKIPFEIIITDDCSKDNTREVLKNLAIKYQEIKIFLNDINRGAPGNRNFGISQSKGNFIYMLDHDNVLAQNSVQKLIDAINIYGCGAASFEELYFFKTKISNHRGSWIYKYPNNLFTIKEFITCSASPAASNNYMYTRAAFDKTGGYPDRGARENMGFGLRLVSTGTPIAIVPGTKYFHRILESGMWLTENNEHPEKAHKNMALNFREFLPLFDEKSQKLLLSEEAFLKADNYIKEKKLKLSDRGWELSGGKEKYRHKFIQKFIFWINKLSISAILMLRKIKTKIKKAQIIIKTILYYHIIAPKPSILKKIILLRKFIIEAKQYKKTNLNKNFLFLDINIKPSIFDNTTDTLIDYTYFYQGAWCARKIFENKPKHHYDIGSKAEMTGIISQFTPTTMIDIRPLNVNLRNLMFIKGDILSLPFKDNSLDSVSSICVIEHIGLGRYGDKIDYFGSEKAIKELKRILSCNGSLYISLPVDTKNLIYFNAHRAFTRDYIMELFYPLKLIEEKYIYKRELTNYYNTVKGFGTGLFYFKK